MFVILQYGWVSGFYIFLENLSLLIEPINFIQHVMLGADEGSADRRKTFPYSSMKSRHEVPGKPIVNL